MAIRHAPKPTVFRVVEHTRFINIDVAFLEPQHQMIPVHTLVIAKEVSFRDSAHISPPVGDHRGVCSAHNRLTEYVDTML